MNVPIDHDTCLRVRIEGHVQGVSYRAWTVREAQARKLNGWVRNRGDGCVEAVFSGSAAMVAEMVALCRRGPPMADVTRVTTVPADPPDVPGFRQLPTL